MIRIRDLHKSFGTQIVLDGISLDIEDGHITAVVGPSGTGKSVLLKIITGLLDADDGDVSIDGESMTATRSTRERQRICRRLGVLFQAAALFDSLNVFDNVAFPLRERRQLNRQQIEEKTLASIENVGMSGYELAMPGEISIGMRKRVGMARALVTDPDIILFDEPNTGLDPTMGQEIYDLIAETQQARGFTGIVISHEIPEVFQICSRVAMLYKGKVQEEGTVEEFVASHNPVVKQFMNGEIEGPIQFG